MKSHEDLQVWQLAMELVDAAYDLTSRLPDSERFGLVSQIQRAAVSIPANIAEGAGRTSTRDFVRFLSIAQGSLAELRTLIQITQRRSFSSDQETEISLMLAERVGCLLSGLHRSLRRKINQSNPLRLG